MRSNKFSFVKNKYSWAFAGSLLLFLIVKLSQIGFKFSDENIYFYMSKLILNGQLPYKDFFFASPPLQLIVSSFFLKIFGNKVILLKLLPIIFSIMTATLIFILIKKKFNPMFGFISSILYLFSFVVLTTTDHFTGVHLTTMFLIASIYFIYEKKYFLAGIISSLALLTRLYVAFAILGIIIYLLISNRKNCLNFLLGISVIFLPVNLILIILFKQNYLIPVYLYHFLKVGGASKMAILKFFLRWDFVLILLSSFSLFFKEKKQLLLPLIVAGTTILFYLFYMDIYYLYLEILIPFLAILGGFTAYQLIKKYPKKYSFILVMLIFGMLLAYNSFFYIQNQAPEAKITFIGNITNYIEKNSIPQDKIYGSFEITPLVALLSNRKIYNNYVDTNEETFLSGIYNITERTNELKTHVKFVIMKVFINPRTHFISMEKIIDPDYLLKDCNLTKVYKIKLDYNSNAVLVFNCKKN